MNDYSKDENYIKQKEAFKSYYQNVIRPIQIENDKVRTRYVHSFYVLLITALIFTIFIAYLICQFRVYLYSAKYDNYIAFAIIAACPIIAIVSAPVYRFKRLGKNNITQKFIDFFGGFKYIGERGIDEYVIDDSRLFSSYNVRKKDDYFTGEYKNVKIEISEESLKYAPQYKNKRSSKEVFKGIFILLSMNKNFKGRTVVKKDKGLMNVFNKSNGLSRVVLEDITFEQIFEVYSSDQIEARYILTTAFMERILHLRNLYNGESIQLSFYNNQLFLAIPTKYNMFETCSFFKSNVSTKNAMKVFEQFYTIFTIIEILKLNQKLGM